MIIRIEFIIAINSLEMTKLLIGKGADVNAYNKKNETPSFKGSLSLFLLFEIINYFEQLKISII